jgi:tetratricopeptide (TPR) repeat protein
VAHYRLRQLDSALIALRSAAECDPGAVDSRIALAEAYAQKGDDNRALAAFEAALRIQPDAHLALRGAAALYLRHDMNTQAVAVLKKLAQREPVDAQVHADLGAAYAGVNDTERARVNFERALQLQPANVSALIGLGHLELKSNHPAEAIRILSKAVSLDPKAFEPYFLRATAYEAVGRAAEAAADFEKSIKLGGKDPQIYYHLARAYRALGRETESRQALKRFSELRRESNLEDEAQRETARAMLQAKSLIDSGSLREAIAVLERAREKQTGNAQLLFRLAGLYFDTQQYEAAQRDAMAAVELAPSEWTHHYLLGLVEKNLRNWEAARRSLDTALHLNPGAADVFNQLGDLAMRRNDFAEAVRNFGQAARLDPHETSYELNLRTAERLARR